MSKINYYKVICSKLSCEAGVLVSGRLDVKYGCPYKGYGGLMCLDCSIGEKPVDRLVAISLSEYDKLDKRFPDIS